MICVGCQMNDFCPLPLLFLAVLEARKYKWDKSYEAHHDVGDAAVTEWFHLHWKEWFNAHWVEHLQGQKFYEGFSEKEFNVTSTVKDDKLLIKTIVNALKRQGNDSENLGIIFWATQFGKDMHQVMDILRGMDINSKRYIWDGDTMAILCTALVEAEKYKWLESEKAHRDLGDDALKDWFTRFWNRWLQEHTAVKTEALDSFAFDVKLCCDCPNKQCKGAMLGNLPPANCNYLLEKTLHNQKL